MDDMAMDGGDSNNKNSMKMMMQMSFYWGKDAVILFSGWPKHNLPMYILALFFVFLLAFAVEFLATSPPAPEKLTRNPVVAGSIRTVIYGFKMGLTYLLMLAVMSFNVGIFIAAVAGHTLGFFVFKIRLLDPEKTTDPKV